MHRILNPRIGSPRIVCPRIDNPRIVSPRIGSPRIGCQLYYFNISDFVQNLGVEFRTRK